MRLIVLAGDASEYYIAKRDGHLPLYDNMSIVFINSPYAAENFVSYGDEVVVIGRFWDRRDAGEIYKTVQARVQGAKGPWRKPSPQQPVIETKRHAFVLRIVPGRKDGERAAAGGDALAGGGGIPVPEEK